MYFNFLFMKSFLTFLLGIIFTIASFGIYQFYIIQKNTTLVVSQNTDVPTEPTKVIPTEDTPSTCATDNMIGNGYSFCAPSDHNSTKNILPDGSKSFIFVSRTTGDTITIEEKLKSVSYTDSDSKFGDVIVVYNTQKKIWEATGECDAPAPCNRSFVTNQGLQVFIGRSRWLTYIVPLDNVGILVFNSTGGGFTKPLEELIQTVKIEKK
jgi:hypothetical protein